MTGIDREIANKLISLGRRHGRDFLGLPSEPLFGMLGQGRFVTLMRNQEEAVQLLRKIGREVAQELRLASDQIFIKYSTNGRNLNDSPLYDYTTAIPRVVQTLKRSNDSSRREYCVHHRRITYSRFSARGGAERPLGLSVFQEAACEDVTFSASERHRIPEYYLEKKKCYESLGEEVELWESEDPTFQHNDLFSDQGGLSVGPGHCFLYGDEDYAALYVVKGQEKMINTIKTVGSAAEDFYHMFEAGQVVEETVVSRLSEYFHNYFRNAAAGIDPQLISLKALSTAATLYQNFSNASVDVRVLRMRLHTAAWMKALASHSQLRDHGSAIEAFLSSNESPFATFLYESSSTPECLLPYELSSAAAFACMTMFESGHLDVDPQQLLDVMAMSSGRSTLYY